MVEQNDVQRALEVIAAYSAALASGDTARMKTLRSSGYVLDWVHGDAYEDRPLSAEETDRFWPGWLNGFPEMDWEMTRTIAAPQVVVVQWTFTGVHSRPILPPIFDHAVAPTGRAISIRGISVYDVDDGQIQRETTYIDLATLYVELGVDA